MGWIQRKPSLCLTLSNISPTLYGIPANQVCVKRQKFCHILRVKSTENIDSINNINVAIYLLLRWGPWLMSEFLNLLAGLVLMHRYLEAMLLKVFLALIKYLTRTWERELIITYSSRRYHPSWQQKTTSLIVSVIRKQKVKGSIGLG